MYLLATIAYFFLTVSSLPCSLSLFFSFLSVSLHLCSDAGGADRLKSTFADQSNRLSVYSLLPLRALLFLSAYLLICPQQTLSTLNPAFLPNEREVVLSTVTKCLLKELLKGCTIHDSFGDSPKTLRNSSVLWGWKSMGHFFP